MRRFIAICAAAVFALAGQAWAAPVKVDGGQVDGKVEDGLTIYRGLPFAAPPVGDLRWKAPARAAKWEGVRDATAYGPICMQKMPNPDNGIGQYPASEDCLTLNVFTQDLAKAKRPVMVWIHGGGFVNGSGAPEAAGTA